MKQILTTILLILIVLEAKSQCSVIVNKTDALCFGDCNGFVQLMPTGTAPFIYNWSTGDNTAIVSGLCAGTYSVTITDDLGCVATTSIVINEPPTLELTVYANSHSSTATSLCDGTMGWNITGGNPDYILQWYYCGTSTQYNSLPYFCPGEYYCVVQDDYGCIDSSECLEIINVAGFEKISPFSFEIFPNPTKDIIQIKSEFQIEEIIILDLSGKIVFQSTDETITNQSINVEHLSDGLYQLVLQGGDFFHSETFIKTSE